MKNFLFCILLFAVNPISAQLTKENQAELSSELLRLINQERASKKLAPLQADPKLQIAATTHSTYMAKKKLLTDEETGAKEPGDRVRKAKGKEFDFVGENVLSVPVPVFPLKRQGIRELAQSLFEQWKSSPPHYANMLHSEYTFSGFGFAIDKKTGTLYVTNVLGRKGAQISGQLSKNAFGLQKGPDNECGVLIGNKSNMVVNLGNCLTVEEGSILFYYYNIQDIRQLIDQPNDGFAIDVLLPEQMECGKPNELDVSPIYDGGLLKPVYRDELFASNKAEGDYRLIVPLGNLPAAYAGKNVSLSLIVIQNGKVCSYEYPIELYSQSYELTPVEPVLINEENIDLLQEGIEYSIEIPFDFERNITKSDPSKMEKAAGTIYAIDIASFSSVEGRTEDNVKLQNSRAEFIRKELHKNYHFKDDIVHTTTMENWPKMRFQLKYFDLEQQTGNSENAIKSFLAANKSAFWDSLLFEQRRSYAVLHIYGKADESWKPEEVAAMSLRTAIFNHNDRLANKALYELYHSELELIASTLLEASVFQELKTNPALVQNASAVLLKDPEAMLYECTEFLDAWINRYDELSPDARKNLLNLYTHVAGKLLQAWDVPSQRLARVIHPDLLFNKVTGMNDQSLLLNFHLAAIAYFGQINAKQSIQRSFDFIRAHFNKADLSSLERTKLALFYNEWSQYKLTNELLFPHIDDAGFSEDEAILLMGTTFVLQENFTREQVSHVMERAFDLNPKRWCKYISQNFQLRRDPFVKDKVCSYCGDE